MCPFKTAQNHQDSENTTPAKKRIHRGFESFSNNLQLNIHLHKSKLCSTSSPACSQASHSCQMYGGDTDPRLYCYPPKAPFGVSSIWCCLFTSCWCMPVVYRGFTLLHSSTGGSNGPQKCSNAPANQGRRTSTKWSCPFLIFFIVFSHFCVWNTTTRLYRM